MPECARHGRVGLEVGEVVLLLEAGVLLQLRRDRVVTGEPLGRDRLGDDDARRRAAAELVLEPRPLVVERRGARDPEPPRGHRQLVRAVRECEVEPTRPSPRAERREPRPQLPSLAERGAAAVMADHRRRHPVRLDQLEGLRVVARGDLDLVTLPLEQPDERPEHERVRARREVDPDLHATTCASGASRRTPSTCRSCHSVNARRPQSWRERSSRPAA